jgi:hypothetical protein
LCGFDCWHIRVLVDDPWSGGHGFSLKEVGDMTLDQAFMVLADRKLFKQRSGVVSTMEAMTLTKEDGKIRGRAADGTPLNIPMGGKSVARQLKEQAEARKKAEEAAKGPPPKPSRKRGKRRGKS